MISNRMNDLLTQSEILEERVLKVLDNEALPLTERLQFAATVESRAYQMMVEMRSLIRALEWKQSQSKSQLEGKQ